VPFLLAERARSECARSMRAVQGTLGPSLFREVEKSEGPRWTRAIGDQTDRPLMGDSEKDRLGKPVQPATRRAPTIRMCSLDARG